MNVTAQRHWKTSTPIDSDEEFRRAFIRSLSLAQRRVLMDHGLGKIEVAVDDGPDMTVRKSLKQRHLIKFERGARPSYSEPTEAGRMIIGTLLGMEAEKLVEDEMEEA